MLANIGDRAVCRTVIRDDDLEIKSSSLGEYRLEALPDLPCIIPANDDYRNFHSSQALQSRADLPAMGNPISITESPVKKERRL
jgi:hypothetical protein